MLSATDRRKHSLEATAGKNKKVLREAWIDLDHSSAAEEMFRINLLVRRRCAGFELVRIPAAAAAVLAVVLLEAHFYFCSATRRSASPPVD